MIKRIAWVIFALCLSCAKAAPIETCIDLSTGCHTQDEIAHWYDGTIAVDTLEQGWDDDR